MNPSEPRRTPRVLIVDDSAVIRVMLPDQLRKHYTVEAAKDYAEAAACIQAQRPDAILLDLHFKGGTAGDVIQLVRQVHGPSVAVVGMSGDVGKLNAAVAAGMFTFHISKPPVEEDVLKAIADALAAAAQEAEDETEDVSGDEDDQDEVDAGPDAEELETFGGASERDLRPAVPSAADVRRAHQLLESGGPLAGDRAAADELMELRRAGDADDSHLGEHDDESLAAHVLRHPAVVRAIEHALEEILPATPPLMRVPAGVASLGTVLRWLLNQIGATRYEVSVSHQEGLVVVYVWDGQVLGVASDAWPQDDRIEAGRGILLPPPEEGDVVRHQREMLEWAGANGTWLEVRRQSALRSAPVWALAQPSAFHELTSVALTLSGGRPE